MIVTNSTSSLSRGLRKSWILLYPETFFSAMPEKISSLRRFSYLSAFWGVVHPCQILPITLSSFACNQPSTLTVAYDTETQAGWVSSPLALVQACVAHHVSPMNRSCMEILSRSAVGVLPRMGTLLLAALTLATCRGDPQMFKRLSPFWHSRSVHSRSVLPNSFCEFAARGHRCPRGDCQNMPTEERLVCLLSRLCCKWKGSKEAAGPEFELGLSDSESVVLAGFPSRQQTRFTEHAFDLFVRILRNRKGRPAHRWGDGHATFVHR